MTKTKNFEIVVDKARCKKCGICIHFCPKDVLAKDKDGYPEVVNKDACIQCMLCELRCPDFAIRLETEED